MNQNDTYDLLRYSVIVDQAGNRRLYDSENNLCQIIYVNGLHLYLDGMPTEDANNEGSEDHNGNN